MSKDVKVPAATRREFLERAALSAAMAGFGPGIVSLLAEQTSPRPYRDLAIRCAQWIDKSAQEGEGGRIAWPADPLKPASIGLDFYNGMPGIVYFYANLFHATGDVQWRNKGLRAGGYMMRRAGLVNATGAQADVPLDAGLYTGLAGLATALAVIDDTEVGEGVAGGARGATQQIIRRAKTVGDGVEWSDSNDIISGTAGTGLFLLYASARWKDPAMTDLAARAGRRLLKTAQPAEGGLMWFPSATLQRNYPNFSHGTAGVAYFLATLYEKTSDKAFLDAAIAGAKYLMAVATTQGDRRAIFHQSGGGEDRYYLSWCHGPVGTARLFWRLFQINHDRQWFDFWNGLTTWVMFSGAPEQQSAGFWNNISQCCGNVGIGQYWIDMARLQPKGSTLPFDRMLDRTVKNTMARAKDDEAGLRWVQAENRVSPDALVAQTGFMQGAAGVGTFFLQLDAYSRGVKWPTPLPDTPWT